MRFSNERAHFVVLQFTAEHNLAFGSNTIEAADQSYQLFCRLLEGVFAPDGVQKSP